MADTDIRCHRACVYSGCSVMCNKTSVCDTLQPELPVVIVALLCYVSITTSPIKIIFNASVSLATDVGGALRYRFVTHAMLRKRCSFSCHQSTGYRQRLMTASDWCPHSAVGRVHSLELSSVPGGASLGRLTDGGDAGDD